jgi:hypothetical protein
VHLPHEQEALPRDTDSSGQRLAIALHGTGLVPDMPSEVEPTESADGSLARAARLEDGPSGEGELDDVGAGDGGGNG